MVLVYIIKDLYIIYLLLVYNIIHVNVYYYIVSFWHDNKQPLASIIYIYDLYNNYYLYIIEVFSWG